MLSLRGMSCSYGAFEAVRDLDLEVVTASITALIGANGAGKSSTLMAIAGHVAVGAGSIHLDGEDVTAWPPPARVRAGIAPVPEGRRLFADLSVEENLVMGGYALARSRTVVNRARVIELFPRLGERLGQRAGSLSGGEQQMLAIGRALMAEPRLLLIDELSLGLMPKMVDACYRALSQLQAAGMTILLVEQSTKRVLDVAAEVTVLESGRAVWQGSAAQARADPALVKAYLGMTTS
jgi:branched-chain amino acid transport system ATP-binding protein